MVRIQELKEKIENRFPKIDFVDKSRDNILLLEFVGHPQHDYFYYIWFDSKSILVDIGAKLQLQNGTYFWHDDLDFFVKNEDTGSIIETFIFDAVSILGEYKTRIIQNKKLLSQTFICEYYKDNKWIRYSQRKGVRFSNLDFPNITGKRMIYE